MSQYILIHGAWHGAWCWERVVPLLEQQGHQVQTPDLSASGPDKTPLGEVTLASDTQRVCTLIDAQAEPVILVGHSSGGVIISQVAEERPDKVKRLVYLTAFLAQNGETVFGMAEKDHESLVPPYLQPDQQSVTFKEGTPFKDILYGDCSDADVAYVTSRLVPQAISIFSTPVSITPERFGRVPRAYISCLQDHAVTPSSQKRMYTATPCQTVLSLNTSHSPFFSAPQDLTQHLISLATANA
jgi:pimeloyl-ACP methyl ester carboxylesterase